MEPQELAHLSLVKVPANSAAIKVLKQAQPEKPSMLVTLKDVQKKQRAGMGAMLYGAIITAAAAESGKYAEVLKAADIPTHQPESDGNQTVYKALDFQNDEVDFIEVAPDMALIVQKYFTGSDYNDTNFQTVVQADSLLPMMHVAVDAYRSTFYHILNDDAVDKAEAVKAIKSLNADFGKYMTAAADAVPGDAFVVYKMVSDVNKTAEGAAEGGEAPAAEGAAGEAGTAEGAAAEGTAPAAAEGEAGTEGQAAEGAAPAEGEAAAGAEGAAAGEGAAEGEDEKASAEVQKLAGDVEKITKALEPLAGLAEQLTTLNDSVTKLAGRVETVEGVAEKISGTVINKSTTDQDDDTPPSITPISKSAETVWTKREAG